MQTVKPRARRWRVGPGDITPFSWLVHGDGIQRSGATLDEALKAWNQKINERKIDNATRAQA
jgi:hypothetical protein